MSDSYFGLYRGVCAGTETAPSTRIKVKVPQLMGTATLEDWALACVPPGWKNGLVKPHANHTFTDHNDGELSSGNSSQSLTHTNNVLPAGSSPGGHVQHQLTPKIGEGVWVMFEGGDVNHPVWMGVFGA